MGFKIAIGLMVLMMLVIATSIIYTVSRNEANAEEARIQNETEYNHTMVLQAEYEEGRVAGYDEGWNGAINKVLTSVAEKGNVVIDLAMPDGSIRKIKLGVVE